MKILPYILIFIIVYIGLIFLGSSWNPKLVGLLIASVAGIWTYFDARRLNIERFQAVWYAPASTPAGAATIVWLLTIITFPVYLIWREKAKNGLIKIRP